MTSGRRHSDRNNLQTYTAALVALQERPDRCAAAQTSSTTTETTGLKDFWTTAGLSLRFSYVDIIIDKCGLYVTS